MAGLDQLANTSNLPQKNSMFMMFSPNIERMCRNSTRGTEAQYLMPIPMFFDITLNASASTKVCKKKYTWNMIISHVPKTLNPFEYVDQYLTENQLQRLLAYESRSNEQVDALICMLDMEEFCDENLRTKVITFFRKAAGT